MSRRSECSPVSIDANARNAPAQIIRWLQDWPYERPSLTPALLKDFVLAGLPRSLHTFRNTLADRIEDKLPRVQAPTLVVRGSRDPIPQDWAEEVTGCCRKAGWGERLCP